MKLSKDDLRKSLKDLRAQLHQDEPDAPNVIAERFPIKLAERYGPTIALYLAKGDEIDPAPLTRRLMAEGHEIALPRVEEDGSMTFRAFSAEADLENGPFSLRQPNASAEVVHPTLVIAPLLGFDAKGTRLGYGKGHYDRALANLKANGRVVVCGLAYSGQEVLHIPAEETDMPLDWVVTPERTIPLLFSRIGE